VTRVAEYGAFIELEEGLSGLLHASEMVAPDGTEVNPSVQYAPGTQVTVRPRLARRLPWRPAMPASPGLCLWCVGQGPQPCLSMQPPALGDRRKYKKKRGARSRLGSDVVTAASSCASVVRLGGDVVSAHRHTDVHRQGRRRGFSTPAL
jgi:hypothetical protein